MRVLQRALRRTICCVTFGRGNGLGNLFCMKEPKLVDLSKRFAVDIIKFCQAVEETKHYNVLINQLLRSGTSIGANIHEANYAASRADFINKMQIALKECYETSYWLDLFISAGLMSQIEYDEFSLRCGTLRRKLISSKIPQKGNNYVSYRILKLSATTQFERLHFTNTEGIHFTRRRRISRRATLCISPTSFRYGGII